jgi:hypothetical protein
MSRATRGLPFPALLALLAAAPAGAVIGPPGAGFGAISRWEAAAHEEGARLTFVTGIEVDCGDGRNVATFSGVFLGCDAANRGYVLTAAHGYNRGEAVAGPGLDRRVTLTFGPRLGVAGRIEIPAARVHLHPGYRFRADSDSDLLAPSAFPRGRVSLNDLAIFEFAAGTWRDALDRAGIRPATLFDGEGPSGFADARIAGFGLFGTVGQGPGRAGDRVHAGHSRVALVQDPSGPTFQHRALVRAAPAGPALAQLAGDDLNHRNDYLNLAETTWIERPNDRQILALESHPQQAYIAGGDSGGPLLLEHQGAWKLAGIATGEAVEPAPALPDGQSCLLAIQTWEPVMGNLDWIRAVVAGSMAQAPAAGTRKRKALEEGTTPTARKRPALEDRARSLLAELPGTESETAPVPAWWFPVAAASALEFPETAEFALTPGVLLMEEPDAPAPLAMPEDEPVLTLPMDPGGGPEPEVDFDALLAYWVQAPPAGAPDPLAEPAAGTLDS